MYNLCSLSCKEKRFSLTRFHTRLAHYLFDEIPHRDLNTQLATYVRTKNTTAAWLLFNQTHCSSLSSLTSYSFTPLLTACSSFRDTAGGKQIHALMTKMGTGTGTISKTALMDMYSKCSLLDESVRAFEEIENKDVVSWNALLSSFLRRGFGNEAIRIFREMKKDNVEVTEFTLCSVIKACALLSAVEQGKQVHGMVVVIGSDLVVLGTALIDLYSTAGKVNEAMRIYSSLNCNVDDAMLNSLISGCVRNKEYEQAFSILRKTRPNAIALTSVLISCSDNSDLRVGKQIHCVATRFGFTSNTQLCNAIFDMYAKSGKISEADSLFRLIQYKDVVSWTSMIDAYGVHGHGTRSVELFRKMCDTVSPNSVTFLVVLSACARSGLVKEGKECFYLMREKRYSFIEPEPEHIACFIDILSRAGETEEIWCLFDEMFSNGKSKPTPAVWAALVNASNLNMDFSRGEFVGKNLIEAEPDKPENYVLVSNLYASMGKWDCVDRVREVMREKGLLKGQGTSWIATGQSHLI